MSLTLTFCSGAGTVTGANFLLETGDGTKFLVDCGLLQGGKIFEDKNREPFPYDAKDITTLFVTHAHLDHVGRIPRLVKAGFKGRIVSTAPTREIGELVLLDSMGVMEKESRASGKEPFYTKDDVNASMALWDSYAYGKGPSVGGIEVELLDAGHILGSTMYRFITADGKKLVMSGDLGNSPAPLLHDTAPVPGTNVLVMESVYGDRNHEDREQREAVLEDVIEETVARGGTLLIPAFSVERTQELLFELNSMAEAGRIPRVPIFLDSPLAIAVTAVYKKYDSFFNDNARGIIMGGDDVFKFPGLTMTKTTEESKAINDVKGPKIIMAGSGMSNGGRILHHERRHLSDPTTTLLLIGYQAAGTLGRQIQDGAKMVNIMGDEIEVRARVEQLSGYSAHKDADHLFAFAQTAEETLQSVYCVMGEPRSAMAMAQRIRDNLGIKATAPQAGDKVVIF